MKSTSGFSSADLYRTASELPEVDRIARVELFERIRRESELGVGAIKSVTEKIGVHRRALQQALKTPAPLDRSDRCASESVLGPVVHFHNRIQDVDRKGPQKASAPGETDLGPNSRGDRGLTCCGVHGSRLRARARTGDCAALSHSRC